MKKIIYPRINVFPFSNLLAVLINIAIAYLVYMVTRVAFVLENWSLYSTGWDSLSFGDLLAGSLRFDTAAILYTNALWVVLMLLPVRAKERPWWHTMCKYIFVVINSLAAFLNLADAVYSQFTGRRTTATFFSEFSNEGNLGDILFTEIFNHWYFLLLFIVLVAAMVLFYVKPHSSLPTPHSSLPTHHSSLPTHHSSLITPHSSLPTPHSSLITHHSSLPTPHSSLITHHSSLKYYLTHSLALLLFVPLAIAGMRGGFTTAVRPITISNANQYVNNPTEAAIVLNTPFSLIRTIGKKPFADPHYMTTAEMDALYTPLHPSTQSLSHSATQPLKKNIVILIVESFGREYTGFFNRTLEGGTYKGFTPFLDSLAAHSLTFEYSFANGRKSIDGMPSILSSIPMFVEPFFVTSASLNDVSGIAGLLTAEGYSSAFFHGAENGSMGFQAFARTTGFQNYYGRTEYNADSRFGGDKDFDGTWAIWDEPFLQYYALTMSDMPQPFVTAVFTASSHHPYNIPDQYRKRYPEGKHKIYKCVQYTDNALRRFFETAKQQPWYDNTLFVITADHTNTVDHDEYRTSLGLFSVPIIFFDPSGELPRGMQTGVAQQIDIMPTLLSILGYDKPYIAFGKNLLADSTSNWAVNYCNDAYQYVEDSLLLLFDGQKPTALYNYVGDPLQKNNLLHSQQATYQTIVHRMALRLKAIIQSYMSRMTENQLIVR